MNQSMSDKGDRRTAPATPGLLIIVFVLQGIYKYSKSEFSLYGSKKRVCSDLYCLLIHIRGQHYGGDS